MPDLFDDKVARRSTTVNQPTTVDITKKSDCPYLFIPYNKIRSDSAKNKVLKATYEREMARYYAPRTYSLVWQENGEVKLKSNIDSREIYPNDKDFIFVVLWDDKAKKPVLKIATGCHFFAANKAEHVLAAGNIYFKKNRIVKVTPQSGGYGVDTDEIINGKKITFNEFAAYDLSVREVLKAVGLLNRYKPFKTLDDWWVDNGSAALIPSNLKRFGPCSLFYRSPQSGIEKDIELSRSAAPRISA